MKSLMIVLVAIFSMLVSLVSAGTIAPAAAGGWWDNGATIANGINLGDIQANYQSSYYPIMDGTGNIQTQLDAYLYGTDKVDFAGIYMQPNYAYTFDINGNIVSSTQNGYRIDATFEGKIAPSTSADLGLHSGSYNFNARGLVLSEVANVDVFGSGNGGFTTDSLLEVQAMNFDVTSASASYNEWTTELGDGSSLTSFNYNVEWLVTLPTGQLSPGFIAPSMSVVATSEAVPEPSMFALIATALIAGVGIVVWRRRRDSVR